MLQRLCQGDASTVERLVAGERERHPGINERSAYRRAIDRLRDDRR